MALNSVMKTSRLACLLVLCSAILCVSAQNDENAAIIQTSIMSFRVSGVNSANFSQSAQTDFSNNLRNLLSPFNFMSVAVNDFQGYSNYVDVSVRAVDATDANNLTSTWAKLSNQVVTGTFAMAFNALLANAGVGMNTTVLSMSGQTTPAGTNVKFAVTVQLSGGKNLQPFNSSAQNSFITPITTYLGDHGNASIAGFTTTSSGVNVDLNVTVDANTLPQFFFFLANSSGLQQSLPSLGGSSLQTNVGNYTVYGSDAPPAASAPAALKAIAPAPVQSSSTVTAAEATGVAVPPVSSSSSGTVTMNLDMTLYGSDTQPFDSSKQFAAASSMASVFWIIVGTGSVNILTFSSFNASGQPASTALGTTQQYGRKLLQSSGSSNIPAENVTFAVTLPSASQNSLLVLQSDSDKVKQQFAGWFVTQMASRGLTVDANVNKVSLSGVSTSTPSSPSSSSPSTSSGSGSSSRGSSHNVGAIVGGVLGGVFGAALLALLAFFLLRRSHNKKQSMAATGKAKSLESDSSDDMKGTIYWEAPRKMDTSPIYTKDAETLKKTIATMLTTDGTIQSADFYNSPVHSRLGEVDSAHAESVKGLLQRKQQESRQQIETASYKADLLLSALGSLASGTLFYNKYIVENKQRKYMNSVVALATLDGTPNTKVCIKFFPAQERYMKEKLFYENRQALEGETASEFIPIMLDAYQGEYDSSLATTSETEIPSSIVLERGGFTLAEYLAGKADLAAKPEEVNRSLILFNLCKSVEFMHARHLVHGSLTTDHVMWFSAEKRWKMLGFTNSTRSEEPLRVEYDLRYAAPELVLADLARLTTMPAKESVDIWALGCIAFEVLAGQPLFGPQVSDEEVMAMLLGFVKLPWESNPDFFVDNLPLSARTFVSDLLRRSPQARKPITTLLHSPLFSGLQSTAGPTRGPVTELQTPANLNSVMSDW